jgi:hypothetical protein
VTVSTTIRSFIHEYTDRAVERVLSAKTPDDALIAEGITLGSTASVYLAPGEDEDTRNTGAYQSWRIANAGTARRIEFQDVNAAHAAVWAERVAS